MERLFIQLWSIKLCINLSFIKLTLLTSFVVQGSEIILTCLYMLVLEQSVCFCLVPLAISLPSFLILQSTVTPTPPQLTRETASSRLWLATMSSGQWSSSRGGSSTLTFPCATISWWPADETHLSLVPSRDTVLMPRRGVGRRGVDPGRKVTEVPWERGREDGRGDRQDSLWMNGHTARRKRGGEIHLWTENMFKLMTH